jgi:hypothetical protein
VQHGDFTPDAAACTPSVCPHLTRAYRGDTHTTRASVPPTARTCPSATGREGAACSTACVWCMVAIDPTPDKTAQSPVSQGFERRVPLPTPTRRCDGLMGHVRARRDQTLSQTRRGGPPRHQPGEGGGPFERDEHRVVKGDAVPAVWDVAAASLLRIDASIGVVTSGRESGVSASRLHGCGRVILQHHRRDGPQACATRSSRPWRRARGPRGCGSTPRALPLRH